MGSAPRHTDGSEVELVADSRNDHELLANDFAEALLLGEASWLAGHASFVRFIIKFICVTARVCRYTQRTHALGGV